LSNPGPAITTTVNQLLQGDASDGCLIAGSATNKLGFYGTTPIAQRALAAQATSLVGTASSTALDTATKAALIEVMNTLTAIGIWKGSQ
jgi:hypothetical protein